MRLLWIAAIVFACRSAPPPPPVVIVVSPPVVVAPPRVCAETLPAQLRCDPSCAGTMDRAPGPGDCDDCPPCALHWTLRR
jgi:hypothetical protein